jgi:DNA-binding transcriptional LysR family regulator
MAQTSASTSLDMQFFVQLARSGSLTAAARDLQVTTAAVSKRLTALEARLGVSLLDRSTRRMSLTESGRTYLDDARRILDEITELESRLQGAEAEPAGLLRVNATLGFGRIHIGPAIATFCRAHPRIEVQLQLSASPPTSEEAYDVGIRFGHPPDSRLVARKLAPNRRVLCASPAYLARVGHPHVPADLALHNIIAIRQADEAQGLLHLRSGKKSAAVRMKGSLSTNDGEVAVNWALAGLGVVLRAEWDVKRYLGTGRLRQVLEDWEAPPADIYAVWPQRHARLGRVQAFVAHLREYFA